MLLERSMNEYLADKREMTKYTCERITVDGMKIELAYGREEGPVWVVLFPTWNDECGWELLIETNDPEWASVKEVYNYFRRKDMTSLEWQQELFWEMHRNTIVGTLPTKPPSDVIPYWDADLGELSSPARIKRPIA
jgi:hypothetical protein